MRIIMSYLKYELVRYWQSQGFTVNEIIEKCKTHGISSNRGTTPGKTTIYDWIHGRTIKSQCGNSKDQPEDLFSLSKKRIQVLSPDKKDENLDLILSWHLDGYTFAEIAVKCKKHGFVDSMGNKPSVDNVRYWVKKANERLELRDKDAISVSDQLVDLVCRLVDSHSALCEEVHNTRSTVDDEKESKIRMQIYLTQSHRDWLRLKAYKEGSKMSNVLRALIDQSMSEEEKCKP